MQPYFFPYLGHFALIASVDKWIVFDVTQYTPKTWMNRNRILHPKQGWQYVTVPLSNASISIKTFQANLVNVFDAKQSIIGKLSHYKKKAPYFDVVNKIVERVFDSTKNSSLVNLNINSLKIVCEYLGIPFSYQIASEMLLEYPPNLGPGEWAPYICKQIGAKEYINPIAGRSLFNSEDFIDFGISLSFSKFDEFKYSTTPYEYHESLSILDVMMWNSPESILNAISLNHNLIHSVD